MRIEIISGSPRQNSLTRRVAIHLYQKLLRLSEVEVGMIDVAEYVLPPVETVVNSVNHAPKQLKELSLRMFEAEGFILVTPEYNGSYSPAMKTLLDHFPKQNHKAFGIVTASPGIMGGIRAALQVQQLVFALFGIGSPHMLVVPEVENKFEKNGGLLDYNFKADIEGFVSEFVWLAKNIKSAELVS